MFFRQYDRGLKATGSFFGDKKNKALTIFRRISHRGGQWLGKERVWSGKLPPL